MLCMTYSSTPNESVQRRLNPHFKINPPSFCCSLFLEYLDPWVRISKMVKKHTVIITLPSQHLPAQS